MITFYFKAIDREGKTLESSRQALNQEKLLQMLQSDGLFPITVSTSPPRFLGWREFQIRRKVLSDKQVQLFTRELQTLLQSGLALEKALQLMLELVKKDALLKEVLSELLNQIKNGAQLSDALRHQSKHFSPFYISLIQAGELGGSLDSTLGRLSVYLENTRELKDTVSTALMYPAILSVMAILSLMLLLIFVVPQFSEMFESAGKELPLPTQIVIAAAKSIQTFWWMGPLVILLGHMKLKSIRKDPNKRKSLHALMLKLPLVGEIILRLQISSFCRTLGTLLESGVSITTALNIVQDTLTNDVLKDKITNSLLNLKGGDSLSMALEQGVIFPILAVQMIKIGEETGQLSGMLHRISTIYDKEIKTQVQRLLTLIEPIMIVTLGLLIGGIIVSMLLAIVSVNDLAV